jgi:hypothetical protein
MVANSSFLSRNQLASRARRSARAIHLTHWRLGRATNQRSHRVPMSPTPTTTAHICRWRRIRRIHALSRRVARLFRDRFWVDCIIDMGGFRTNEVFGRHKIVGRHERAGRRECGCSDRVWRDVAGRWSGIRAHYFNMLAVHEFALWKDLTKSVSM